MRWLDKYLGNKKLVEIDRDLIAHIRQEKAKKGVKNRTINAVLQQIRGVLRLALDLEMVDKIPQIKLLSKPKGRIRWLTEEEEYLLYQLPRTSKAL